MAAPALLLLLGLGLALLPAGSTEGLKRWAGWAWLPFLGAEGAAEAAGERAGAYLSSRPELLRSNRELRRENRRLRLELMEGKAREEENRVLREALGWREGRPWDLRLARVILGEPSNWRRGFHIDAGSREGIGPEDPVLTSRGLLGKVAYAAPDRSRVSLLGDPGCKVSARVEGLDHGAGVVGPAPEAGPGSRLVAIEHLPGDAVLEPGALVSTSGLGGVFPRGIPIGRLAGSRTYDFGLRSGDRVRLLESPDRVDEVWVIRRGGRAL